VVLMRRFQRADTLDPVPGSIVALLRKIGQTPALQWATTWLPLSTLA